MAEDAANDRLTHSKTWNRDSERRISEVVGKRAYRFDESSSLDGFSTNPDVFSMDTPPPYPSGKPWHIGAVAQYAQIDMMARSARMLGNEVLFPVGIDRNGIPVERYTEKKYNISMRSTSREEFLGLCRTALDELEKEMLNLLDILGYSADFGKLYRTDSDEYRAFTQSTFIQQWNSKNVYKGMRPINYCTSCGTTIADAEVEYSTIPSKLAYIKFALKGSQKDLIIATTRPELLAACGAVIVNPSDERYKDIVGKKAIVPLYGLEIDVLAHEAAKPGFGSGAVMLCSYGDYNDVLLFKELNLKERILIDTSGKMNAEAGKDLAGMKIKEARIKIVSMLKEKGVVERIEDINHSTPICERSKTPIEIIPLEEYFLKTADYRSHFVDIAKRLEFIPDQHRQILINWINVASDWPISRRRFYGTEIPIWYCDNCGEPYVPPPGKYYKPWKESPPEQAKCSSCGGRKFTGDERTFDTWMDSSVSALFVSGFGTDSESHKKAYPMTVRTQGVDIIRTWMYYSIVRCWQLSGEAPWKKAWVGGMGLDEHGMKMSKSIGNIVDPSPLIEKYGVDAFRFWTASEASIGSNFLYSESKLAGSQKFLTKLFNLSRLIHALGRPAKKVGYNDLMPADKWILGEFSILVKDVVSGYKELNFFIPSNRIRSFVWSMFAPHYAEMVKARAYGNGFSKEQENAAIYTLNRVLEGVILLAAPICPFITEALWSETHEVGDSVHLRRFPEPEGYDEKYMLGDQIIEFNSKVWSNKKENGLSLKDSTHFKIPDELKDFADDLKAMHNIIDAQQKII